MEARGEVREIRGVRWRNEYKIIECACNNQRKYTPRGLISHRGRKEGRKEGIKKREVGERALSRECRRSPYILTPFFSFRLVRVYETRIESTRTRLRDTNRMWCVYNFIVQLEKARTTENVE